MEESTKRWLRRLGHLSEWIENLHGNRASISHEELARLDEAEEEFAEDLGPYHRIRLHELWQKYRTVVGTPEQVWDARLPFLRRAIAELKSALAESAPRTNAEPY